MVFKEQTHAEEDADGSSSLSPNEEVTYYEPGPSSNNPTLKEEKAPSLDEEFESHQPAVT